MKELTLAFVIPGEQKSHDHVGFAMVCFGCVSAAACQVRDILPPGIMDYSVFMKDADPVLRRIPVFIAFPDSPEGCLPRGQVLFGCPMVCRTAILRQGFLFKAE